MQKERKKRQRGVVNGMLTVVGAGDTFGGYASTDRLTDIGRAHYKKNRFSDEN